LAKEPTPEEPLGQSCCTSAALGAGGGGALADGAGVETDGPGAALADGAARGELSSLEQPTEASSGNAAITTDFRIRPILAEPRSGFRVVCSM